MSRYNMVEIEVDDASKTIRFGETLTSGSTYDVVVRGGAETVGSGSLLLMVADPVLRRRPRVLAHCALAREAEDSDDVGGVLDLSTREMAELAFGNPGAVLSVYAVLHSDEMRQNVADGMAGVKMIPVATSASDGAAMLFQGPQGKAGRGIASVSDGGIDGDGNRIAVFEFSDGEEARLAIPKGDDGIPAKMTAAYDASANMWHQVRLVEDPDGGGLVLCVDRNGVDLSDLPASDASASEAYGYAQAAKASMEAAAASREQAQAKSAEAAAAAEEAAGYASRAAEDGSSAGRESGGAAGRSAAQEVLDAGRDALEELVADAREFAVGAGNKAGIAEFSAGLAAGYRDECRSYKEAAEQAAEAAAQAAQDLSADDLVSLTKNQDIDSVKTFLVSPIVPDLTDDGGQSEAASVNKVASMVSDAMAGVFSRMQLAISSGTLSSTVKTFSGSSYVKSVVVVVLVKVNEATTVKLQMSDDGGAAWRDVEFTDDNFVIVRRSVGIGGEAFRVRTGSTSTSLYRFFSAVYLDADIPGSEVING